MITLNLPGLRRCLAFFLVLLAAAAPVAAQDKSAVTNGSLVEAYILANKVRSDIQLAARLYLEGGLTLRADRTRSMLGAAIVSVDQSLVSFERLKLDDAARKMVSKIESQWKDLKPVAAKPFEVASAELVYLYSEDLSISTSKLCFRLEGVANSEQGKLVDVSGRMMSLTERIAKAALYSALTKKAGADVDFVTWKKEFEDGLALLEASPINDDYLKQNLALARTMWVLFDSIVTGAHQRKTGLRLVDISKSADGIGEIVSSNKRQYEANFRKDVAQKATAPRRAT